MGYVNRTGPGEDSVADLGSPLLNEVRPNGISKPEVSHATQRKTDQQQSRVIARFKKFEHPPLEAM